MALKEPTSHRGDISEALNTAVRNRDLEKVKIMLSQGAEVNGNTKDVRGNFTSYLHLAPNLEITRELLNHGANANACDSNGFTPLHYAVTYCKGLGVIRELISRGAEVNAQSYEGFTPLTFAILFGNSDIIKELLKHNADYNIPIAYSYFEYPTSLGIAVTDYESCAKLIIKANLLKMFNADPQQIIDLNPFRECSNFQKLTSYQDDCRKEIQHMKIYKINHKITLYEFIMNKSSFIKPLYTAKMNIIEEIKAKFPIYKDNILPKIKLCVERAGLLNKWKDLHIFSKSTCAQTRQVALDHDSLYKISEYLSNNDLKIFIKAFEADFSNSFIKSIPLPESRLLEGPTISGVKRFKLADDIL